jgi:hypothetical protein
VWHFSEKRKLAALQEFSDTELDSGWQSLYTLSKIDDPKTKAELFEHCLDEFYHADLFGNLLKSYASSPLNRPTFSREAILSSKIDKRAVLAFLVKVYVGESEINRDFVAYARAHVDEPIRQLFRQIKRDEEGHEEVSWDLMLRYADGKAWKLRWLIFRETLAHAYKRYVKASQAIGDFMLALMLSLIYFLAGLFVFGPLRKRLSLDRATQLEILREQIQVGRPGGKEA